MAKLFAGEVAVRVANEAVQIHGGYGFIKDYPAEKYYRDVKLCTIGEGTSEIQKLVIRSEEHTSELQSRLHLVCRLLLEKKKNKNIQTYTSHRVTITNTSTI